MKRFALSSLETTLEKGKNIRLYKPEIILIHKETNKIMCKEKS